MTTVMCLSTGTPKSNKFSICSKCKINDFWCPKLWAHYSLIIMCSDIGTPKIINFPFGTNGKLMVLGVPIFKHFRVNCLESIWIMHVMELIREGSQNFVEVIVFLGWEFQQ